MFVGAEPIWSNAVYFPQTSNEEMDRRVASLANEDIYDFLRENFNKSRIDELEEINPVYLIEKDSFGQTMLHWAAVKGDVEITKFIIKKTGIELFNLQTTMDKYTALHLAVHNGNQDVINFLVDESKKNGLKDFVNVVDAYGQTALHWAANDGDFSTCEKLYSEMSDSAIAFQTKDRLDTALHFAVQGGHYQIVELLLSKDDVVRNLLGKVDMFGQSALHWAAEKPSDDGKKFIDLFIEKANNFGLEFCKSFFLIKAKNGYTALHIGVHSTSNESVKSLVEATNGIPEFISAIDQYGQTALHWAAGDGKLIVSKYLCKAMKPEDINIQTENRQQTALHFAVQGGYAEIIKLLIEHGADPHLRDMNGLTALDRAEKYLKTESKEAIIKLLTRDSQP